jgi:hypothetical protein
VVVVGAQAGLGVLGVQIRWQRGRPVAPAHLGRSHSHADVQRRFGRHTVSLGPWEDGVERRLAMLRGWQYGRLSVRAGNLRSAG